MYQMTFKEFIILKENIYPFHCKKKLNEKGMLVSAISAPKGESTSFQKGVGINSSYFEGLLLPITTQ